jgi:hypothetical protein
MIRTRPGPLTPASESLPAPSFPAASLNYAALPIRIEQVAAMACWTREAKATIFLYGDELMTDGTLPARPASYDKKVGLVLQGGGALGSYQAGVSRDMCRIGSLEFRLARSMRQLSPAMRQTIVCIACAASGKRSPLRPCCGRMRPGRWQPGNVGQARSWQLHSVSPASSAQIRRHGIHPNSLATTPQRR